MRRNPYDTYLENEVLSADPVRLIRITYRAAIDAVAGARRHLADGSIRERSRQINKALAILHELLRSLDRESGGEIAASLAGLYAYMTRLLLEANATQSDAPLAEAERLLATLLEGWSSIAEAEFEPDEELEPALG